MFIRVTSLALGFLALTAPIFLALFVAGVLESSHPINLSYLSNYILVGLGLSLGYFCVAVFAHRLASVSPGVRYAVSFLLTLPLLFALYLAINTHVMLFAAACIFISIYTIWLFTSCIWPGSNPSFKRVKTWSVPD